MSRYVIDTSALLAYIENEDGAIEVEQLIIDALENQHTVFLSVVSCIEMFYVSLQEQGMAVATERLQLLKRLPFVCEPLRDDLVETIGQIKASHAMSFADCCIAGLAKQKRAILMHKDPEFEQIEDEIVQHKLPYNTANKANKR